jgi:hypothetical protein
MGRMADERGGMVLEQTVGHHHFRADQLTAARDRLDDVATGVEYELEIGARGGRP